MNIKSIAFLLFIVAMSLTASAQFQVELGININSPKGEFGEAYIVGIGAYIEPKYAISENLDLGLFIGSNAFIETNIPGENNIATFIVPILATGTYRFSSEKVTPYAGLGLGLYSARAEDLTYDDQITGQSVTVSGESSSKFGFAPRAGVYVGRLNLGLAYNIVSDVSFLQFNIGMRIGSRE